jgi:4-hydroxy-tetrahydrodipicolinate synthase
MTRTTATTATTMTQTPGLRGAFTALVTPFTPDGEVDWTTFRRLVDRQIRLGIDGLVPVGTTGESPTLTTEERDRLIQITIEAVAARPAHARIPVIAGTGSNDTRASIEATRRAAAMGADAALIVTPYYNKPDQRMIEAHFRAIADEGGLPVVVYNVPGRTGVNVEADTFLRLAEHPRIVAVKEASANIDQFAVICRDRPRDVAVLSGDDAATLALLAMGGDGIISVASNQLPAEMSALVHAWHMGDPAEALRIHNQLLPLMRGNFQGGPNPVPAKAAMLAMGLLESDMLRLPMLPMADAARARFEGILGEMGLLGLAEREAAAATPTNLTALAEAAA